MPYKLDPNYNPLDRTDYWDSETREVIEKRIAEETGDVLKYEFLTEREGEILELLADAFIPQEKNNNYIKIAEIIDRDLKSNIKGVRYGKNPWPQEFYRTGLAEIEKYAKKEFEKPIEDFSAPQLDTLVEKIFESDPENFLRRFMRKLLSDVTAIYFSHPAGWAAIGFPGPAYPKGYPFLDCGQKEDWEPKFEKK